MPLLPGVTLDDESLLDDVPYNKITYAMTHDSHTGMRGNSTWTAVDQSEDVYHQLKGGVRVLRINSGSHAYTDGIFLRHNVPGSSAEWMAWAIGKGLLYFGSLFDYLTDVKKFLDENRDAIGVALFLCHVFSPPEFKLTLDDLVGTETTDGNWPTPKKMRELGVRIVLFKDPDSVVKYSWMLPRNRYIENEYNYVAVRGERPWWIKVRPGEKHTLAEDWKAHHPSWTDFIFGFGPRAEGIDPSFDSDKLVYGLYLFNHFYYDYLSGTDD
ncbi:hypothetical protein HDV00_004292, partial [Rhizophlyctis rosea]